MADEEIKKEIDSLVAEFEKDREVIAQERAKTLESLRKNIEKAKIEEIKKEL